MESPSDGFGERYGKSRSSCAIVRSRSAALACAPCSGHGAGRDDGHRERQPDEQHLAPHTFAHAMLRRTTSGFLPLRRGARNPRTAAQRSRSAGRHRFVAHGRRRATRGKKRPMPDAKFPSRLSTTNTPHKRGRHRERLIGHQRAEPDAQQRAERRRGDAAPEHDDDVAAVRTEIDAPVRQPRQGDRQREQRRGEADGETDDAGGCELRSDRALAVGGDQERRGDRVVAKLTGPA